MKKIFLIISFLSSLIVQAQYYPMLKENKYWDQLNFYFPSICQYVSGGRCYLCGDTVINSISYKKICDYPILSSIGTPFCPPYYVSLSGNLQPDYFIREDTIARKVYFLSTINNEPEYLLYDFNLSIGDTLDTEYDLGLTLVLDTIENVTLFNGNVRRKFDFGNNMFYIEEIGGRQGLFMPLPEGIGSGSILICVNDSMNIYGDECNIWFDDVIEQEIEIPRYFIDNNNVLIIECKELIDNIQLSDITGKIIFSSSPFTDKTQIELSLFSSSFYFVKITTQNKKSFVFKIAA